MHRALWPFLCIMVFGLSDAYAQPTDLPTSPLLSNALTRVIRTDGTVTAGLFVGLHQDSIYLLVGGRLQKIIRGQIWKLSIERRAEKGKPSLAGLLLGLYAGSLVFFRGEDQPFAFMTHRDDSRYLNVLADIGFAFVGTCVGYLVGSSTGGEQPFDFTGSEDDSRKEWERLRSFVNQAEDASSVHLSFQGAWVDTYLPASGDGSYSNSRAVSNASNFNLMRKMQLAITFTPLVDGGLAMIWLGQPVSSWYNFGGLSSQTGTVGMTGRGYYVLGILKPLYSVAPRNLQWDIGAGVGAARVEYDCHRHTYSYQDGDRTSDVVIQETLISGVVYTEVKVFLSDYLSLGVTGDYVFIPDTIPAIDEIGVGSRSMGTTSIGFVLGIHF